jgi:hypothetical protein
MIGDLGNLGHFDHVDNINLDNNEWSNCIYTYGWL